MFYIIRNIKLLFVEPEFYLVGTPVPQAPYAGLEQDPWPRVMGVQRVTEQVERIGTWRPARAVGVTTITMVTRGEVSGRQLGVSPDFVETYRNVCNMFRFFF